jgi:mono/diheme cytochrome c family protein
VAAGPGELMSEPDEYRFVPPSADVGKRYFDEYGVGDPYGAGIAYPVFVALQDLHPDKLGADWHEFSAKFGTIKNRDDPSDPHALPVGFHLTRDPNTRVDFLVANCQLCHAEVLNIDGREVFVSGLGNKRLRLHAYDQALVEIGQDASLSTATLLAATRQAARRLGLPWSTDYGRAIVDAAVRELTARADLRDADSRRLAAGLPGRVATIEGFMAALNEQYGAHLSAEGRAIGWTKIPDVATWRYRETNSFDGVSSGAPVATVAGADVAFGVRARWYEEHPHIATSMLLYLRQFDRALPYPGPIDAALAETGRRAFNVTCSGCHGNYPTADPAVAGHEVGYHEQVVAQAVVGTDRARLDAVTDAFITAANDVVATRGLVVHKKSVGYVPRPLVDVWARGTYGHAGQWPDLAVLALPPAERPTRFVVDLAAPLNLDRMGVAWSTQGAPGPDRYVYDGSAPGFGVQGHTFLSDLPADDRRAVLEYLKTL